MDGPPPPEEDFTTLSIGERLTHKNWKARVSGYEALSKTFAQTASDSDPAFKPYLSNPDLLKKIATDSNAVAQEKGVDVLVQFVKYSDENAARTRDTVVPALVDKCLGSTRASTKAHAIELCLQYVEVENSGTGVVNDLLPGLAAKQPKTVAGSVLAIKEVVRLFGIQATPPPPILKALPKIFAHTDKTVRAEGSALAQTLYQFLGPGIESWLADLKPVQVKELKESFEAMEKEGKGKGTLKPERMTRESSRAAEVNGEEVEPESQSNGVEDVVEADMADPRAFADPVDIVGKFPGSWQTMLVSSKWKERKEALDDLATALTSAPRIKEAAELGDLARALAIRIQSDANIVCVMTAASCMEALANGLMEPFARYRDAVVPPMLERLKERKATVTESIGKALDAIFSTTSLPDIIPDLGGALGSKNPQVKEGTLKFLARCISTSRAPIQQAQIKPLSESLASLLEDGFEGARNEAAVCLGTLMKMVGERPLNAVIDGLPDVRKTKVKEAFESATVKCKTGTGGSAVKPPPSNPPKKKVPAIANKSTPPAPPAKEKPIPPPKRVEAKPPPRSTQAPAANMNAAKKTASSAPAKTVKATPVAPGALDSFKFKHSIEDAEAIAAEMIPSNILADLGDSNWKLRLGALDELSTWVDEHIEEVDSEVLVRILAKKGSSEKNFQVSAKMYGIFQVLAERCPSFGRSSAALSSPQMSEKLGDLKLKKPAGDALGAYCERTSLQFVLNQIYEPLLKQKAPKVLADATSWINSTLLEFGIVGISLRGLIDFLKIALQNSNAAVRTSATKALVTVKLFAGSSIKDLIQDLNPQLLTTILKEFDAIEEQTPPMPSRTSADTSGSEVASPGGATGAENGDALDDLFPRVEIDALCKGTTILSDAKSDAWKTKKEAMETLQGILDQGANKRLKPSMGQSVPQHVAVADLAKGEIGQVLKARVVDTNKAVQSLALDIVGRIATGMGKPFEKHVRLFVTPVATVLADQKAPIRQSALQTLTAMGTACGGLEPFVPGFATALETSNPLQKGNLLQWINQWFKEHPPASINLSPWAGCIVSSLDDRNSDVRKGSQDLLPILISSAGFDYVMQQTSSLKPASRNSATPLIQAARSQAADVPSTTNPQPLSVTAQRKVEAQVESSYPSQPSSGDEKKSTIAPPKGSKIGGVRRKIASKPPEPEPNGDVEARTHIPTKSNIGGLKRPGAAVAAASKTALGSTSTSPQPGGLPLHGTNMEVRKSRLGRDAQRWVNEGGPSRKDLSDLLYGQIEPQASKDLMNKLFSQDHNSVGDNVSGLAMLCDLYTRANGDETLEAICLANLDLPLKYASMKVHEPQPNLVSKCIDVVEAVLNFLRNHNYQLTDSEASCFIPTFIYKLGDAREQVRTRVQNLLQTVPKIYAYSRLFQMLLEYGLKSKVAKTRQGSLDEMAGLIRRSGMGACEPSKAFPTIAAMIGDKDSSVRKSALTVLSEAFSLIGEKIWDFVGPLSPKDKTQLEERLRRVPGPSNHQDVPHAPGSRIMGSIPRPSSPASKLGSIPRPSSPLVRSKSPTQHSQLPRPNSPAKPSRIAPPGTTSAIARPKSMLPSRLGRPRSSYLSTNGDVPTHVQAPTVAAVSEDYNEQDQRDARDDEVAKGNDDISITISSILSSDASRSVDALKKIQKILSTGSDGESTQPQYQELAEHTEGLIETITLQMAHVFERPDELILDQNFRLAKHLIQTLNNFCDHQLLAESLTVDILTSILEELTVRLLETDDSGVKKIKDLSRFINMIILRLFATGRRMSIFRALFALLLQIVKPFPANGTPSDSKEAKIAELVLKCVWKLARNIPQDLTDQQLDPVELFPAIEHFLQSVPPNEWRARATNKVPCGDMPLRTIKVIIQHVVAHYGDDVYDLLSTSFDDPSATIVYPYVYRILNSSSRQAQPSDEVQSNGPRAPSPATRPLSPQETGSSVTSHRRSLPSRTDSPSVASADSNGQDTLNEEPDPDAQLLTIISHISSETTGALHKEGITELHHYLKAYPHKRQRVEKMLDSTGAAFRKYINRALASREAEDKERNVAVADTLSKLEANKPATPPLSPVRSSPRESSETHEKLSRLHDIFQYRSSSTSNGSSPGRAPRTSIT